MAPEKSLELVEGIQEMTDKENYHNLLDDTLKRLCQLKSNSHFEKENVAELLSFDILCKTDIPYLEKLQTIYKQEGNINYVNLIESKINNILTQYYNTLPPYKVILKSNVLTLLDVLDWANQHKSSFEEGTKFHITIAQDKFCIFGAFVKNREIEYTSHCGIGIFLSKRFYIPKSIKIQQDKIIIDINKIDRIIKLLNNNFMKEKEAYDKVLQEIGELNSHVNVFSGHLKEIEKSIRKKMESESVFNKNIETFFETLKYETVFEWIRKNYVLGADGVILNRERNHSFGKQGEYKILLGYVKGNDVLVEDNQPKMIYYFDSLDDSLDDLFGSKNSIILKNK
jgi:hypothetical protein